MKQREIPSLRRSIIGLSALVILVAGGFIILQRASDSAQPEDDGILLRYTRSGGLAGDVLRVVVRDDGSSVATYEGRGEVKRRSFELSTRELQDLDEVFERAPWPEVSQSFPLPEGADFFQYDVNYRGVAVKAYDPLPNQVKEVSSYVENRVLPKGFATTD